MIPKLIHQTAKTADIPEQWRAYQQKVRDLHPDWTYRLWTDDDNLALVKSELPDFVDVFTKLPKNIMRADVIRYVLMYLRGGLYLDLDYEMLKPLGDLAKYDCVLAMETPGGFGPESRVANAFFASAPGHPFFKAVLDELRASPPIGTPDVEVLGATGPAFISRVLHERFRGDHSGLNMRIAPREWFDPRVPRSARQYRAVVNAGVAYGIHYCHGTWRNYSLRQRLRNQLGAFVRKFI
jgi:inositol phosphorylceramide mannosyltransferase catalytic subunit